MGTVLLASVRQHARRYVATGLAIAVAVAFMVAIDALASAARQGASDQAAEQFRGADVAVSYPSDPDRVATTLAAAPGVTAVDVSFSGYGSVQSAGARESVSLGTVAGDEAHRWQSLTQGRWPLTDGEVVLDEGRRGDLAASIGDTLRLGEGTSRHEVTVVGLVDSSGGPRSAAVYLTPGAAAGADDLLSADMVTATVVGDPSVVVERLTSELPLDTIETGSVLTERLRLAATDGIDVMQRLAFGFVAIAVVVGVLVIANTFSIVLAQRARDLALLRCVGATRRQAVTSIAAEAALLGVAAGAVGVGLGFGLAALLVAAAGHGAPTVPLAGLALGAGDVLVPLGVAVAVTLLASWWPARRASQASPLAALRPAADPGASLRAGAPRLLAGAALVGVGCLALASATGGDPLAGVVGATISFVGVLLVLPAVLPRLMGILARPLASTGVPARLAGANVRRHPRRTAVTASALLIGVTLVTSVVVGVATVRSAVATELDRDNPLDVLAIADGGTLRSSAPGQVATLDDVTRVATLPGARGEVAGVPVTVIGADAGAWGLVRGDLPRPAAGEIYLPYDAALLEAGMDGDTVTVRVGDETRDLTVRFADGFGAAAVVAAETLRALAPDAGPAALWAGAAEDADAGRLFDRVLSATGDGVDVAGGVAERADVSEQLDLMLIVTLVLLGASVVIAVIGIGNALGLSVLERLGENGLLRALGLSARGLRATLAFESVLLAAAATLLGLALGAIYAWFGVQALGAELFEVVPSVVVPWSHVLGIVTVALLAGLGASVVPARRAASVAPIRALGG